MPENRHFNVLFKLVKNLKRDEFRNEFPKLHGRDQAEFFQQLYPDNKKRIADLLDPVEFAEFFEYLDKDAKLEYIKVLPKSYLLEVFNNSPDDEMADFISDLDDEERALVLSNMSQESKILTNALLNTEEETAGAVMTTKFITVSVDRTLNQVIEQMRKFGRQSETIYYLYCVDGDNRLVGVVSLKDLILSPGDSVVQDVMNPHPIYVSNDTDQEEIAKIISDYDLLAVPVVDLNKVLVGIVTVDDVIDILEDEVTEDFHKFSGIMMDESNEADSVLSMTKQRLPWIIILIFLGLISANLISYFEHTLSKIVSLASFMPIILDSAGNVGTQSLAVSVRELTLGEESEESFLQMLGKEFLSGVIMGIASGFVIGMIAFVMYRDLQLALIVGLSLALTLSVATVIGASVPNLFNKLKIDPAVASGPFITTICDTIALVLYFGLATKLLI